VRIPGAIAVLVAAAAAALACGSSEDAPAVNAGTFAFEAFTFDHPTLPDNGAPFGNRRAAAAIGRSDADVLCLNGVYDPQLRQAVAGRAPFNVDLQTDEATETTDPVDATGSVPPVYDRPACIAKDEATMSQFVGCLKQKCSGPDDRLTSIGCIYYGGCVRDHNVATQVSVECHACFHSTVELGGYTLSESLTRCRPPSIGVPRRHRGRHGTMLLSKHPLSNQQRFVLPSSDRYVVLAATVTLPNAATVDAYCLETRGTEDGATHYGYRGQYGGGPGEFRERDLQLAKVVSFVRSRSQDRPAVILAELGSGPEAEEQGKVVLDGQNPTGLAPFENAFVEALPAGYRAACTTCGRSNLLLVGFTQVWTTHIFLSGMPATTVRSSHRTFIGDVVKTGDARQPQVPLSVNYGFRSRIAVAP